ncbi:hypothetical protein BS78_02G298400 [Paspalum vaginatum]|nr:hypothetical protein BS78_02G298400 [Paspalum vaginatum]
MLLFPDCPRRLQPRLGHGCVQWQQPRSRRRGGLARRMLVGCRTTSFGNDLCLSVVSHGLDRWETAVRGSISSGHHEVSPPSGSPILARFRGEQEFAFYIRVDRQGPFHTYPDVSGPFQSLGS